MAKPAFQQWAARFPLTRPLARRHSAALFDLAAGFVFSQTLFTCVSLDLFARLQAGPRDLQGLAHELDLPAERLERLLGAASELGLLQLTEDGLWDLGEKGAVVAGNPGIAAMVRHHAMLYRDLADPVRLLRQPDSDSETARFWRYAGAGQDAVGAAEAAEYSRLMTMSQDLVTAEVLEAYPFSRHRRLLDVGGGEGAFVEAIAGRHAQLELGLFDLPAVAARARQRLTARGLAERCTVAEGDFFADPLPPGADVITLSRILCDHDDPQVARLLRNCAAALAGGGRLVIAELMGGATGGGGHAAAYFGLYFLAMGSGRSRRPEEIGALLAANGFQSWRRVATNQPLFASVIVAEKGL